MSEAIYSTNTSRRAAANDEVMPVEPLTAEDYQHLVTLLGKARDWLNHDRERSAVKALEDQDLTKDDDQEGILAPATMKSSSKDDYIVPWYITRQELCYMFGYGNNVKNFMSMLAHFPDHPPFFHRAPTGTVISERNAWIDWCRKYQVKDSKSLKDFRALFKWLATHKISKVTQLEDLALQSQSFQEMYEAQETLSVWFLFSIQFFTSFGANGAKND